MPGVSLRSYGAGMPIKTDIAEVHTQRVAVILRTPGLSADDKRQGIQDEFEKAMEQWARIVAAYGKGQGAPRVASRKG